MSKRRRIAALAGCCVVTAVGVTRADWLSDADARIDEYRKANLTVNVVDAAGHAAPGATVHVDMTRQAFGFGTTVNQDYLQNTSDPNNAIYRQKLTTLFNKATLEYGLTWNNYETPAERIVDEKTVAYLQSNGLDVRGQHLIWENTAHLPADVQSNMNDPAYLKSRALSHITDEAGHFGSAVNDWTVLNEHYASHVLSDAIDPGYTPETAPVLADYFNAAHAAAPTATLAINDYGILASNNLTNTTHQTSYYNTIKSIQSDGGAISSIGFQSHFGSAAAQTSPDNLVQIINRFATLNLPMQVTEFDMYGSGWTEQSKADYLRQFLTVIYSEPEFTSFGNWGFWDGKEFNGPDAGLLFDQDWNLKLTGQTYEDLVFNQWWTDVTGQTNAGQYATRAFLGDYDVTVTAGGVTRDVAATLGADGTTLTVVVPEPAGLATLAAGAALLRRRKRSWRRL